MGSFASRVVATQVVALDGTGDYYTIQEAIDALPATGGVVYVKEGIYDITTSGTIIITNSNVAVIGAGKSTKIITTADNAMINISNVSGILIDKLYLYGVGYSAEGENRGITFTNVTKSRITNCWIEHCANYGIQFGGTSEGNIIDGCFITGNRTHGIDLSGSDNNIINRCVLSDTIGDGIAIRYGTDGNSITHNYISGNTEKGLLIASDRNIISENLISSNDYGVVLHGADNNSISNNIMKDNTEYDIWLDNTLPTSVDNLILGNQVAGSGVGSILDEGSNTRMAHNVE